MPPKKYCRNYASHFRRSTRKSKVPVPDPQETHNPFQESPASTLTPPNLETPSLLTPNLRPCEEITTTVVDLNQTLINGTDIQDFTETVSQTPVESKQETLVVIDGGGDVKSGDLNKTLINGSEIQSNVQDFTETPVESKQEALVMKELVNDGGGDGKSVAVSETKNVVKKKKIKIVKRKVLKKINRQQGEVLNQDSANDGNVVGDVKIMTSNECVYVNVETPNLNTVESVDVESGQHTNNIVMESENCESSAVCESIPTFVVWSEAEKCSVVGGKQKELEAFEVVKHCVDDENFTRSDDHSPDAVIMQKENESCVDGSLTDDISKVSGLDYISANKKTGSETGTQLEDCIVDEQNHDSIVENNLDSETGDFKQEEGVENTQEFESEDGKQEEGANNKEECSDFGVTKAETLLGDAIWSGEMGALERRRRRKTEIFVGGLDKDTREEDIRKIFEVLGEIKDVTLVNNSKTKDKAFAFVRYTLAADAKKALIKYRKVEICGRLCGTSPVEGNDTLFLGNIDKRWKSDDVTQLLQGIGIEKIDHVTVISDPNNTALNRGFAFLELESNKDAQNAYKKLQKKGVFGKHLHIKVAWSEPLIEPDESELNKVKSVYAEYLPSSWDEEKVKNFFKRFGDIENVALARDMPSSRRKDFAFINYTTRDAALACVEAFSHEQTNDEGSKVKVSLAKPSPKAQQIKHLRTPPTKESKEKQKGTPFVKNLQGSRIMENPPRINYDTRIVDQRSSMTSELIQLLREQASMRPTKPSLSTGYVNREHPYPLPGRKRPFSVQGDDIHFLDTRGHPRARVEGSYPITNPSVPIRSVGMMYSVPIRGVGMMFLPHNQHGASYISRPINGMERRPNYIQPRERAPYHGNIDTYQRY